MLKPSQFLSGTELEINVSYSAFFSNIQYERSAILLGEREKVAPIGIFIINEIENNVKRGNRILTFIRYKALGRWLNSETCFPHQHEDLSLISVLMYMVACNRSLNAGGVESCGALGLTGQPV